MTNIYLFSIFTWVAVNMMYILCNQRIDSRAIILALTTGICRDVVLEKVTYSVASIAVALVQDRVPRWTKVYRNQVRCCSFHVLFLHHHHVPEGLGVFPVPWSSRWSWSLHLFLGRPMFLRPFGFILTLNHIYIYIYICVCVCVCVDRVVQSV